MEPFPPEKSFETMIRVAVLTIQLERNQLQHDEKAYWVVQRTILSEVINRVSSCTEEPNTTPSMHV